ncbi:N-acetylmuramoyl-L-alanine amidase family protein, partial [Butyrivibrio sp. INlla14]|uniref:N-acetylmuramoyl-L-alanine amidase family protein n=1 Tax=Butyrivibrio sp. INlla14 TaxID=1520808 RepID=UPI000876DE14
GIGWRCIVTSYDENFNMTSMTFASPTYDIETPELPEPTIISKANIKSDPSLTFTIVDYGKCVEPTLIPETNGIKVTFLEWVRKNEEGDFESYKEDKFDVGYYKARFRVEIDPEYKNNNYNYLLDADCEYYMDGRDCSIVSRAYGPESKATVLSAVVDSPEFYSKFTYGEYLSRVRVENGVIRFDPYRGADKYEIIIAQESFYTEENFFDPTNAFYKKGLPFGSYTVYVRAVKSDLKPISALTELRYQYSALPEAGKHKIETINANSNIGKVFVEGQKYENPTFDGPDTVTFMSIHWQKYLHEQFIPVTADDKDYFSEGRYRFKVLLHINSEYYYTHEFADNPKLIVNGVEWTCDGTDPYDDGSIMNIYFLSPEYTIKGQDDPDEPEDPETIKGTWKTKYGSVYFEKEDGEYLTGMQKIDGEYYLFSKRGTLQKNVFYTENGKTYYFAKDGKMVKGFKDKWSATYYFDEEGVMQTGFVDIDGDTYYFKADGRQTKSTWITVGDAKYYTKADGRLAKSETIKKWGKKYSFYM